MEKPTIAVLPGAAAGAGLSIALACDFRLAAEAAFITTGFRNVGLSGDYGASWLLPKLVGPAKAKQLFYTAERVQSSEAHRLGIFQGVFPDAELHTAALTMAKSIATGPRHALRMYKLALNDVSDGITFKEGLDNEARRAAAAQLSANKQAMADFREATSAFVQKRKPMFS